MKKKIIILIALTLTISSSASYASLEGFSEENTKVAIVQQIMTDIVKGVLYKYGSQALDRYVNPTNNNYYNYNNGYNNGYNYNNGNNYNNGYNYNYNTNTQPQNNTNTQQTPTNSDVINEPLIPVS